MLSERRRREIAREYVRARFTDGKNDFELWRNYDSMVRNSARAFTPYPNVLRSNSVASYIAVAESAKEAFDIAKIETPKTRYDAGTPEITQYGKYWIVYD